MHMAIKAIKYRLMAKFAISILLSYFHADLNSPLAELSANLQTRIAPHDSVQAALPICRLHSSQESMKMAEYGRGSDA